MFTSNNFKYGFDPRFAFKLLIAIILLFLLFKIHNELKGQTPNYLQLTTDSSACEDVAYVYISGYYPSDSIYFVNIKIVFNPWAYEYDTCYISSVFYDSIISPPMWFNPVSSKWNFTWFGFYPLHQTDTLITLKFKKITNYTTINFTPHYDCSIGYISGDEILCNFYDGYLGCHTTTSLEEPIFIEKSKIEKYIDYKNRLIIEYNGIKRTIDGKIIK